MTYTIAIGWPEPVNVIFPSSRGHRVKQHVSIRTSPD